MILRILFADPMLRMLVGAILLAAFLPVSGASREVAQSVADVAIFLLFLLNGMRIARKDMRAGFANWRFFLPLILWVFGSLAVMGFGANLVAALLMPPLIATGFLYLGVLPSTVQSATSYSTLGGGNIALSVIAAALLNILGVFVSVPLFLIFGGSGEGAVGSGAIIKILLVLILPFAIGQIVQTRTTGFIAKHKPKIVWMDRLVIAIAVYVAFSGAVTQGIWTKVGAADWAVIVALVALMLALAHCGAWLAGGALALRRPDRVSFLFAGAQKSAAIGVPLAAVLFPPDVAGFVVVPLLLYHLFQLVLAAPLSTRLARHPDAAGYNEGTTRS
ncbi:bile acid:sodium symporter [Erythrobacter litoralis]|uniref:bile acid:sodium symporter family protein n=1 Tax=Erythrobacter litoralis TaxID=39960 RepID=UPI002434DF8C|nr:bile acid:sodium symporter [Erythrobacter litoralis]MDG6079669.1 bile acid:sodium symporter [Erythrobacter litoralis]